jgi:hypothetical protein
MFLAMIAPSTAGIHVGGGSGGGNSSSAGVSSSSAAGHTSNGGGAVIHGNVHYSHHVYAYANNNFVGHGGYYYRCSWINGYRRCGLRID